ncbi:MAG: DUF2325 domain-containing protein [Desulfobulbus sp.]|jgi:hypothetical protein
MLPRNIPGRKRKIWEIDGEHKCSLIGTSLGRMELRRLGRDRVYQAPPNLDDYHLHMHFIKVSGRDDQAGRALHKYLERKYRVEGKKYRQAESEDELAALWEADLAEGRVGCAWWCLLVHPCASMDLITRCYGRLHMFGHEAACGLYRDRQQIAALRAKVEMLQEVLVSERKAFRQERRRLVDAEAAWREKAEEGKRHAGENRQLQDEVVCLRERVAVLEEQNAAIEAEKASLEHHGRKDGELARVVAALHEERELRKRLQRREQDLAQDFAALESLVFEETPTPPTLCARCADQDTENCPGLDLCGKTVLYVGGLHRMVPHYRNLVEQYGGRFLHHDGGKEASRNKLPRLLDTADAVLCPIDCVSHDACNCVKKMCKRQQKPLVFMRGSGLSALERGLNEIVQ